jgi:hypothetical protein
MLAEVPSREAGVLMAMLGIFHNAMKEHDKYGLDHAVLATRVREKFLHHDSRRGTHCEI